jgi:hypothetical protein
MKDRSLRSKNEDLSVAKKFMGRLERLDFVIVESGWQLQDLIGVEPCCPDSKQEEGAKR